MASGSRVYIRKCAEYDRAAIEKIVSDGMRHLGYVPRGKIFVKPNVVIAGPASILGTDACTHRALVGASLLSLAKSPGVERVDVGEKSAIGFPTRYSYGHAGYFNEVGEVARQSPRPVSLFSIDEDTRDALFVGGAVHSTLRVARTMARADSKVYLPKLKCHCVSHMTGAVKLNIGICSDDERSIRHDFLLDEKIVDLLSVGYPDFIVMDAIDVGVGNEAYPTLRKLGLIIQGTNPVAVDMVGARLLGLTPDQVPYLKAAVARGYAPSRLEDVSLEGDITTLDALDIQAKKIQPYDDEFYRWQDVAKELERLRTPLRFYWGPYKEGSSDLCRTGCVMGIKMYLAALEKYAGADAFAKARPTHIIIGKVPGTVDAGGRRVIFIGNCSRAHLVNPGKVMRVDKCFTTASDMTMIFGARLGIPTPMQNWGLTLPYLKAVARSSLRKIRTGRYAQDMGYFLSQMFVRKI